jgi:hypothetical protein
MKKIALLGMLLVAGIGGCGTSSGGGGTITVSWTTTIDGASASCTDVQGATVSVSITGAGTFSTSVACSAHSVTSPTLRPGNYTVTVALLDSTGAQLSLAPVSTTVTVLDGLDAQPATLDFDFQGGTLSLTWMITQNGFQVTCGAENARTVEVTATPLDGATARAPDLFNCTDMGGTTDPFVVGQYHVRIRLLDASNQQLNLFTPTATFTVRAGDDIDLGNFVFAF